MYSSGFQVESFLLIWVYEKAYNITYLLETLYATSKSARALRRKKNYAMQTHKISSLIGIVTTTELPLQQRMDLYLNTNIGVASAPTNEFSVRCVFGRCKCITQRI
jgi:hypothetical protein